MTIRIAASIHKRARRSARTILARAIARAATHASGAAVLFIWTTACIGRGTTCKRATERAHGLAGLARVFHHGLKTVHKSLERYRETHEREQENQESV